MNHVTVSPYTPRESFAVGSTPSSGPFQLPATFVVFDPTTDILVYNNGVLLTYSGAPANATQWSFTGTLIDGGYQGGQINLGGTVSSTTIIVTRNMQVKRTTDFPYPSSNVDIMGLDTDLDRIVAMIQDRVARANRALTQPDSDLTNIGLLPTSTARAGLLLGFDGNGNPQAMTAAGINWRGAWSGATAYAVNDAVSLSGSSYICILANTNQTPPNATYWAVLAAVGAQGPAGAGSGDMLKANNLSDVASAATSRTNLGLGSAATLTAGTAANNAVQLDGSARLPAVDGSQLTNLPLAAIPTGIPIPWAGRTGNVPAGFLLCNGQAVSRTTYAALMAVIRLSATVTMTIASPCVVTWTAHGLDTGDPIKFTTTGALPTGLTAGTTYYVSKIDANTFNVTASPGSANINTSGTQSGTHTGVSAPWGDGDGSTTFNVPDLRGRAPFGHDLMGTTAASRITNAGSGIYGNGLGQTGGAETVALSTAQMPAHTHSLVNITGFSATTGGSYDFNAGTQVQGTTGTATGSQGSGNAHNNMPGAAIFHWIVKT